MLNVAETTMTKQKLLLHICCAPCSAHVLNVLATTFKVTGLFYNPNIHPGTEYALRHQEAARLCRELRVTLVPSLYRPADWFSRVRGYEREAEGRGRCAICIRMRLEETARAAADGGYECFGTTLTISPHKDAALINRIGVETGARCGVRFHEADFKKGGGYTESCRLSRERRLYRQRYCGCIFSAIGGILPPPSPSP
jgi:predicted adenine nucleotide alpha hydrolase (AANH) superfamily ATPase